MLMVSKPNKIILDSIATAKGLSVDEVKENLSKKKVKTRKRKKRDDSTIDLISSSGGAKTIEFSQVKGRIHRQEPKEKVYEWGIRDVALYIRQKYSAKFQDDWKHKTTGVCPELMRLHDRILDIFGHCDYLVLRDYVDYIFDEEIEGMIDAAKGVFYVRNLREDQYIASFSEAYDFKKSFEKETTGIQKQDAKVEDFFTSNKSIEEVFFLSEESFVTTYGIVVCIFWLIKCQEYSNGDAAMRVLEICKKIHNKGDFKIVKEKTEFMSPYHESIKFPKMEEFLKNIDGRYKIDIEYKENDIIKSKFKFLEEQE